MPQALLRKKSGFEKAGLVVASDEPDTIKNIFPVANGRTRNVH